MVGFLHADPYAMPPFARLLPHGLILNQAAGIGLLSTPMPRWKRPSLALGCAWDVVPRNIDVCDESVCLDMARLHEGLLKTLPVGAALQVLMTILPATSMPAWEALRRECRTDAVVQAQCAAMQQGLPYREGPTMGGLRTVLTTVTVRLPIAHIHPAIAPLLKTVQRLSMAHRPSLADTLTSAFAETLTQLDGLRRASAETLQAAGHAVHVLSGMDLGQRLALLLDPFAPGTPALQADEPLRTQVLTRPMTQIAGGIQVGEATVAQVLSLQRAPAHTYPGILCAPRVPAQQPAIPTVEPLALWQAHPGPLTLAVQVAVVDSEAEKSRLKLKRMLAGLHGKGSVENAALKKQLDSLLETFFLTGGELHWGRVHVVAWGTPAIVARSLEEVQRRGRKLGLELLAETGALGSTLLLQTLPLGFDPAWPAERVIQRARRLPGAQLAHLLPLYGSFHGTETPVVAYTNQRGEAVGVHVFDSATNPHMIWTGTSGAGKTFGVAHFANQVLPLGGSMVILDPLANYRELCAVHGGTYVKLDFNHPLALNPFAGALDNAHAAFLTASLAEMASGGIERLTWEAFSVLATAVSHLCLTWDRQRGEPTLGRFVEEVLQDGGFSPKDRHAQRLAQQIARKLSLYYGTGQYAGFIDGPNQFHVDPKLTVIELSQLSKTSDLQAVLFFALFHLVTQFFEDPVRFYQWKFIVADETWALLKHAQTADVIEKIIRTYRNIKTSAIFLSQRVEDFDSPVGKVILGLVDTTLFLQPQEGELPKIQRLFQLTDAECQLVRQVRKHAGWSSAYLRLANGHGGMVRLIPDRFLQLQQSQDSAIAQRRTQAIAEARGNVRAAIAAMLQEEAASTSAPSTLL